LDVNIADQMLFRQSDYIKIHLVHRAKSDRVLNYLSVQAYLAHNILAGFSGCTHPTSPHRINHYHLRSNLSFVINRLISPIGGYKAILRWKYPNNLDVTAD
jgi:hypothetical protein